MGNTFMYENNYYTLKSDTENAFLYQVKGSGEWIPFSWPKFEIEGKSSGIPKDFQEKERVNLTDEIVEITGEGVLPCGVVLTMKLRVSEHTPIVRFQYILSSEKELALTKMEGEALTYFSYPTKGEYKKTEVRFSGYDYLIHGYQLEEIPAFQAESQLMGPILAEERDGTALLTAYEHGSQYPDKFVVFESDVESNVCGINEADFDVDLNGDTSNKREQFNYDNSLEYDERIYVRALRGNYWNKQSVKDVPYETIWLQAGAVSGNTDDLAHAYREYQLKYCTLNPESRKPYIFYNTWAFQERNKFYNKKAYLASMNQERMEQEIEIAHRMGVDVFVIDTGWYQKTGDWEVDLKKFPNGMAPIREKLDAYGMKLGLWFNPTVAARTSQLLVDFPESMAKQNGVEPQAFQVWETEESFPMCIVSEYWKAFADYLIYLVDTIGVKYFKWDAIDLYGCDRKDHYHGGPDSTDEEARDCYAFRVGLYMSKIVDRVCKAHPDVIVDVDITEGRRYFGLGFLSSGKYFSMNNGPYFLDYDIDVPEDVWTNIFVHPGPARGWICRQNLCYDKWIPSILMMTHYLPDEPKNSQMINLASLILGQNGIWGDLLQMSEEGVERFKNVLSVYKKVKDDITEAYPVVLGRPGSTLEVHEKISTKGKGAIVLFANLKGSYEYCVQNHVDTENAVLFGNAKIVKEENGLKVIAEFEQAGAVILFFC